MEELLKHLGFTTPFIYAAAAYGFFHWLDENASDEAKAALARTMRFKDYKNQQVASALVEVFDRIYTYPLLRWRAFFRSLLFTTVVSAIFLFEVIRYMSSSGYFIMPVTRECADERMLTIGCWVMFSIDQLQPLLFNALSDYLSLFVIRPLLIRSGTKPVIGLALGTVTGAAIILAADVLRRIFIGIWSSVTFKMSLTDAVGSVIADPRGILPPLGPGWYLDLLFVWPATAVFVWLPLFALGILIVRLLTPLSWIVGRTQWFLKEGKEHPLKAIGYVAAVVVFLGTVVGRAIFSA